MSDDLYRMRDDPDPEVPRTPPARGSVSMLGTVVSSSNGITAGHFIKLSPTKVLGAESEGGAATLTADTSHPIYAYWMGPRPAMTGDVLLCTWEPYRWVAESVGSSTTTTPCMPCNVPSDSLSLTWVYTDELGVTRTVHSTLTYQVGPPPAWYSPVIVTPLGQRANSASGYETNHVLALICSSGGGSPTLEVDRFDGSGVFTGSASNSYFIASGDVACSPFDLDISPNPATTFGDQRIVITYP